MPWEKIGNIFRPTNQYPWQGTYAAVPTVDHIQDNIIRIYCSGRDIQNHGHTGFIEIDIENPQQLLVRSELPVLSPGRIGTFDNEGAMCSWVVQFEQKKYMYYFGWNTGSTVPFRNAIGLAISDDNGNTFKRYSEGPLIDRYIYDPTFTSNPCVIRDDDIWRMWYISGVSWEQDRDKLQHRYHVKYAESTDGIHWHRDGRICIDFVSPYEYAISRPCVMKTNGLYEMWYSYRASEKNETYRIGYATSADGLNWQRRDDESGIDVSESGWDSEMIEYPCVFEHKANRYMLYNGNGYGNTGIGLAVWH